MTIQNQVKAVNREFDLLSLMIIKLIKLLRTRETCRYLIQCFVNVLLKDQYLLFFNSLTHS